MILEASPDAPLILHLAAAAILWLHIGGGALGILSGWTAMVARKGGRLHRVAGNVFFVSMLVMAGVGGAVAPFLPDGKLTNTTAGIFTFYLVASSWATVKRPPRQTGGFERVAVVVPLGIAAFGLYLAWLGSQDGKFGDYATVYIFAVIAALAVVCDLRMIRSGGVSGVARTARHLWRMTLALFVATGSFFMGQQDELPEVIRNGPLPTVVTVAVPLLLIYWMVRVRLPGISKALRASAARAAPWFGKPAPRS